MAFVTHTIVDRSNEKSFTRHHLPTITNLNYADVTGNTPVTQSVGELRSRLADVTLGNFRKHEVTTYQKLGNLVPATSVEAQRERKVLVLCVDGTNGRRFNIEIPCPRLDVIGQANTDEVDENATWDAFVTELVADFVSPYGNPFTVLGGRIVGRAL